jgi:hypothetical protein
MLKWLNDRIPFTPESIKDLYYNFPKNSSFGMVTQTVLGLLSKSKVNLTYENDDNIITIVSFHPERIIEKGNDYYIEGTVDWMTKQINVRKIIDID